MPDQVTLEQVEQLAIQLPPAEQLRLLAHISERLTQSAVAVEASGADQVREMRAAIADALLQELDAIAESIEGEFDSAEDIRQIREERANRL